MLPDTTHFYDLLQSHFRLLSERAHSPPVALPPSVAKGFAYFHDTHGEESFLPHNFDELMAACAYTQRKGFEKLKPAFDTLFSCESLEALLQSTDITVQTLTSKTDGTNTMIVSKKMTDSDRWAVLQLFEKSAATEGDLKVVSRVGVMQQLPDLEDLQRASWDYSLHMKPDGRLVSLFPNPGLGTNMMLLTTATSKLWLFKGSDQIDELIPTQLKSPIIEIIEKGTDLDLKITQPFDGKSVLRLLIEVTGPKARIEAAALDAGSTKILDTHWHSEMSTGKFFVRKKGNFLKRIDLETKIVYEGEVVPAGSSFTPEGKGVWTQAEPFQRKEGIFKAGTLHSGTMETEKTIVYSDDWPAAFPKKIQLTLKSNGKFVEGVYNGSEFVGETLIFIPGDSLYLGESKLLGANGRGKLWNFKHKVVSEGLFEKGFLANGSTVQLAPEETNLPEREFPDLNNRKLMTKYEGPLKGPLPHGKGAHTNYQQQFKFECTFENGKPCGPFKQTFFDGCWIDGLADQGQLIGGVFNFQDGTKFELLYFDEDIYVPTANTPYSKKPTIANLVHLTEQDFQQKKMQLEFLDRQRAQAAGSESKNPDNKSNMMAGRDWSVSEGSLPGGNYCQAGQSTSLSFGARLPLGFWQMFGFSRAMIVNTPRLQVRPYSTTRLSQGCLQTVLPLRQPVLKMLFRRFK